MDGQEIFEITLDLSINIQNELVSNINWSKSYRLVYLNRSKIYYLVQRLDSKSIKVRPIWNPTRTRLEPQNQN